MQIIVPVAILLSFVLTGLLVSPGGIPDGGCDQGDPQLPAKPALLIFGIIAVLAGLTYYNSVSSAIKAKNICRNLPKNFRRCRPARHWQSRNR